MVVWKNRIFLIFLFSLFLVYIANVQYTEIRMRRAQELQREITQLKWRYWTIKSGMMYEGMEEQVGKKVSDREMVIKEQPPQILLRDKSGKQ